MPVLGALRRTAWIIRAYREIARFVETQSAVLVDGSVSDRQLVIAVRHRERERERERDRERFYLTDSS